MLKDIDFMYVLLQSQAPGPGRYDSFKTKGDTGPSSTFKSKVPRFAGKASVSYISNWLGDYSRLSIEELTMYILQYTITVCSILIEYP